MVGGRYSVVKALMTEEVKTHKRLKTRQSRSLVTESERSGAEWERTKPKNKDEVNHVDTNKS